MKKQIKEHDGCVDCRYFLKTEKQLPCKNCNANYLQPNGYADLWEEIKEPLSVETNPIKPNHYKSCSIECIDAMMMMLGADYVYKFCVCNAIKYIWRYKDKNGIEDLKKAEWYLNKAEEVGFDEVEYFNVQFILGQELREMGEKNE
jgi:hypothetical protein